MQRNRGFTLVELIIVVAIFSILMAFTIQSVVNSRLNSNEGSAVASLRTITSANQQYLVRFRTYAPRLTDFSENGFFDEVLGAADRLPGKSGYVFSYEGSQTTWLATATPVTPGTSGIRHFLVDENGMIHFAENRPATVNDPTID